MQDLLKEYITGRKVHWKKRGRKPILSCDMLLIKKKIHERDEGRAVALADVTDILIQTKTDIAKEKGLSELMVSTPAKRTSRNYLLLLHQLDPYSGLSNKPQQKSERRYTAERSVRNMTAYLFSVAVSHYQIGKADPRMKPITEATDGAQKLYELVQKVNNGVEIRPVYPCYLSSTDDTTVFAFEGKAEAGGQIYLVRREDPDIETERGTRSAYTRNTGSTDSCRGTRIRSSVTITAGAHVAPFFFIVYGLTEKELPLDKTPDGFLPVKIKGLAYGASQDVTNKSYGYVMFVRNQRGEDNKTNDQRVHEYYRNNIFLPFIARTREHYLEDREWKEGNAIDDDDLWVCWQVRGCRRGRSPCNLP